MVVLLAPHSLDKKLDIYSWEEGEDSLKTKWRFSAVLDLPWKPLLAAGGSTTHVFDKVGSSAVARTPAF